MKTPALSLAQGIVSGGTVIHELTIRLPKLPGHGLATIRTNASPRHTIRARPAWAPAPRRLSGGASPNLAERPNVGRNRLSAVFTDVVRGAVHLPAGDR